MDRNITSETENVCQLVKKCPTVILENYNFSEFAEMLQKTPETSSCESSEEGEEEENENEGEDDASEKNEHEIKEFLSQLTVNEIKEKLRKATKKIEGENKQIKNVFYLHKSPYNLEKRIIRKGNKFECTHCGHQLRRKFDMKNHIRINHEDCLYYCPICPRNYKVKRTDGLGRHIQNCVNITKKYLAKLE
ncbi:hypothetical protein KQX54_006971 [Cotesia glomerata]|uniref:C2H2-type domain-containing protein n=1 Tax=Cotesia glomerata TaxID=32391 RepID=A0AAV7IPV8_COTGL|nr:hypothetical protein KQX54_006964 [Cotesia glomerata]KAH0557491.1 hypothetical protein KQX54_006971 [Cotesia glomerata]